MQQRAQLSGASVAVTGAARGIGRAIAHQLARAGAHVAIGDVELDAAESVAAEIDGTAFPVRVDVTSSEQFAAFLDQAEQRHGPLRVMVNNAGVDWIGPFHDEPDEVTRRQIEVNLYGNDAGIEAGARADAAPARRTPGQTSRPGWGACRSPAARRMRRPSTASSG